MRHFDKLGVRFRAQAIGDGFHADIVADPTGGREVPNPEPRGWEARGDVGRAWHRFCPYFNGYGQ